MTQPHPYFDGPAFVILGHRGTAGTRPENTLASFIQSLKDGADTLESDLHLTKDGEIIMMHDPVVDRTTNGTGPISEMTLKEIKALDAGYKFTPDGGKTYPFRSQGIKVPTLAEALSAFPDKRINLEIKDNNQELVEKVVDLIAATGREDSVLLTAGDDETMKKLRAYVEKTGSQVAISASTGEIFDFFMGVGQDTPPPKGVMALQVPYKIEFGGENITVVTPAFVEKAHKHGIHVHVWTIDDPKEMKELRDMGVDGIFTDFPKLAKQVLSNAPKTKPQTPKGPKL